MSSTDRPRVSSSTSRVRTAAVCSSRCSVGSSSTTTGKSASSTRARASRCRCPPDSRAPYSPTSVSRPSGRLSAQSSSRARRSASLSSSPSAPGPGKPQVRGEGGVEDVRVLGAQPDYLTHRVALARGDVHAADGDRPAVGSRNRSSTMASVVLPDPLGPVIAIRRPAGTSRLMPPQHVWPATAPGRGEPFDPDVVGRPRQCGPSRPRGGAVRLRARAPGPARRARPATRAAAARMRGICCAAGARPANTSCAASGTSTTTARATPGSAPDRTAPTPRIRLPDTRGPSGDHRDRRPSSSAESRNGSRCVTRPGQLRIPAGARHPARRTRQARQRRGAGPVTAAASSPRRGATWRSARRATNRRSRARAARRRAG